VVPVVDVLHEGTLLSAQHLVDRREAAHGAAPLGRAADRGPQ